LTGKPELSPIFVGFADSYLMGLKPPFRSEVLKPSVKTDGNGWMFRIQNPLSIHPLPFCLRNEMSFRKKNSFNHIQFTCIPFSSPFAETVGCPKSIVDRRPT